MTNKISHLFITGCPRSGTTDLAALLNSHSAIAIGQERYAMLHNRLKGHIPADSFSTERFWDLREGDTFWSDLNSMPDSALLRAKFDQTSIRGDKFPNATFYVAGLAETFPDARFIFVLRRAIDVGLSWQSRADSGDKNWERDRGFNFGVDLLAKHFAHFLSLKKDAAHHSVVFSDRLFDQTSTQLQDLTAFLGIEPDEGMKARIEVGHKRRENRAERPRPQLRDDQIQAVLDARKLAENAMERFAANLPKFVSERDIDMIFSVP